MYRLISALVLISVVANYSTGYKWIPLKPGNPIPNNAVMFDRIMKTYIGRARHYNLMLPAEIYNTSHVIISTCSKIIKKQKFEVLTSTESCEWKDLGEIADIQENAVRAGSAQNGEPIYIGKAINLDNDYPYLASILLTSNKLLRWRNERGAQHYLTCYDDSEWFDTSADDIPKDTISGGESEDGHKIFVARLLNDCMAVPGQVIPAMGISMAVLQENDPIYSEYCQVLTGNSDKYLWVHASGGEIPDYAVVGGKFGSEFMYVAKVNKTLGYITYKQALASNMTYEILIGNV